MKFCDNCGSFLRETREGLWCPKCKKFIRSKPKVRIESVEKKGSAAIFVVDKSTEDYAKVSHTCPKCRNRKAFHWFSRISGEHAGIRRERTVEHFKCTKCSHSWTESS
jgi:DNA-directed RNA polymerase subunit M/transcription elongation factor TFIIS